MKNDIAYLNGYLSALKWVRRSMPIHFDVYNCIGERARLVEDKIKKLKQSEK